MKRAIFILGVVLAYACTKTDAPAVTPAPPVVQEESVKFSTNLDTGIYNTADTVPLNISVSSKMPAAGFIYSITATWVDSSKQIFKIDTTLTQSSFSLNITGLKKPGNYTLSIIVNSKSTSSNNSSKTLTVINNPLNRFMGYKVGTFSRKNEIFYWRDCGVVWDVIANNFNIRPNGSKGVTFLPQFITGDFNKDGWIDVFNPGTGAFGGKMVDNTQWLIWNPQLKTFENKNLFLDKTLKYFGGNQRKSVSYDFNNDGYTDVLIFDTGDDLAPPGDDSYRQPIRIVLSNNDGSYSLKDISVTPKLDYFHGGDVGDLNGDGIVDLVMACGSRIYVTMGIQGYPFFSSSSTLYDNTTGVNNALNLTLTDLNQDGLLDMCLGAKENETYGLGNKIAINQGGGVFNKNNCFLLPYTKTKDFEINDFRTVDVNNDGLMDIVAVGDYEYDNWAIMTYIQKSKNVFEIDSSRFVYNINTNRKRNTTPGFWKPWLTMYDFDGDGFKDFSCIDADNYFNQIKNKTVFIKRGDKFNEEDFYKYDPYANSIKPK